jgi:alpha-beta hydrolase superfamily lysophospholipase
MVRWLARRILGVVGSVLLGLTVVGLVGYWHFVRSTAQPSLWHEAELHDFTAAQATSVRTLDDYVALERKLFEELQHKVYDVDGLDGTSVFNRYRAGSRSDPGVWPVNWNHTFQLKPAPGVAMRGGALLLHGLTDSPYSMRSIGEHLAANGFEVVGLRLPGHGTAPSGLLTFEIEDMQAAVRLAARDLRARLGPDRPLYFVGYSNGGALAVDYALAVLDGEALPKPAGLVLLSPMIGISPLAAVGLFKTGLSTVPGFARAAWETITLEFDPYKYNSFSFHAGGESHRLTGMIADRIERLAANGPLQGFPPTLVFMSTVDSTVKAEAVTDTLLDRLAPGGKHELVLFDVNRFAAFQELLVSDPGPLTRQLESQPQRPYGLTVVTNASPETTQVVEVRMPAGSAEGVRRSLGLAWPLGVFSLSHVGVPFPPADPLYGYEVSGPQDHVQLGTVAVRGENGVLRVPMWALTRQRSNPFHAYMLERIDTLLGAPGTN